MKTSVPKDIKDKFKKDVYTPLIKSGEYTTKLNDCYIGIEWALANIDYIEKTIENIHRKKTDALKIKYEFLQIDNHKHIMKLMGYPYNETKSYNKNCVEFVNQMEIDGRLNELSEKINEFKK